jgi:hypothetical protein
MALQRATTLTLCFEQKASPFCFSDRKTVNQLYVGRIAVFAPPNAVSGYDAATGGNYHFVASVLGSLKHGPRNSHTRRFASMQLAFDSSNGRTFLVRPIHALLWAQVQSIVRHFGALLWTWHSWHRSE